MAKKKGKSGHGLKYFLDHPQIKRYKAVGNEGGSTFLGGTQTSGQKGGVTQGTKGAKGGTGDMKTNIGKLLTGK